MLLLLSVALLKPGCADNSSTVVDKSKGRHFKQLWSCKITNVLPILVLIKFFSLAVSSLSVIAWNHITTMASMGNWDHKLADTKQFEYLSFSRFSWGNSNQCYHCYHFSNNNAKLTLNWDFKLNTWHTSAPLRQVIIQ